MAKHRHRSAASYKESAKKAARTRKRNKAKRSAAAKKAARTRRTVRHHKGIIGGHYDGRGNRVSAAKRTRRRKGRKGSTRRKSGGGGGGGSNYGTTRCPRCARTIFGGAKGFATHTRKRHRGR